MKSFLMLSQEVPSRRSTGETIISMLLPFPSCNTRARSLRLNLFLLTAFPALRDTENPRRITPRVLFLYTTLIAEPLNRFPVL